jgi:formate--tetrahydrofolate ligase
MSSDIEIAGKVKLKPITEIAAKIGLEPADLELYGPYIAKVSSETCHRELGCEPEGKLILVSAITPTPAGEGKTTISIGLAQGLQHIGKKVALALREPSLGPVMGIKGGATGGGYSQVLPMEEINLHFTGDIPAVTAAHNLLTAMIDNHIHQGDELAIDGRTVLWKHVMDVNDRSLRDVVIGLGGRTMGFPRESGFDITAASEVMAILCLTDSFTDLKRRLDNILVGFTFDREPVTAKGLHASGAMAALLKHAFKPNLVQSIEGVPAFIHGGPFANIAQGANSIMATKLALRLADYVVTEAGFGFDLGAEKFFDIVCRAGKLDPGVVVLVATVRALKMHGGADKKELDKPDPDAVRRGLPNLAKHLENIDKFEMPEVVAINVFAHDTEEEIKVVEEFCNSQGVEYARAEVWSKGGAGGAELARKVVKVLREEPGHYKPLYDLDWPVEKKIETVAHEIYGAEAVDFTPDAQRDLRRIKKLGYEHFPVCIAKTQASLSDNPKLLGRPKDFLVTVRDILINAGAEFLVPITGKILRMPGLPKHPSAERIDIDDEGNITGLF